MMRHSPRRRTSRRTRYFRLLLALACALGFARAQGQTTHPAPANPSPSPTPAATPPDKEKGGARSLPTGTVRGRVVSDDGQPLPHVHLVMSSRAGGAFSRPPSQTHSDEQGKFVFNELAAGLYHIRAYLPGYTADTDAPDNVSGNLYRLGDTATIRLIRGGVITGTVMGEDGEPLAAISVRVHRVRTLDGRPAPAPDFFFSNEQQTDDRGVYRIYGLPPGIYVASAGGGQRWNWMPPTAYDADAPTYFRSATLDAAEEVAVRAGQEVAGIDIRHRGERGHSISGVVILPTGQKPGEFGTLIILIHVATGTTVGNAFMGGGAGENSFSFDGVADGEYELRASRETSEDGGGVAPPVRVSVRGADVTGLRLALAPFASVSGDLVLEPMRAPAAPCTETRRRSLPQETIVAALRDVRADGREMLRLAGARRPEVTPDAGGAFTLRNLEPGRYRFEARPADERWYVRDVQLPAASASVARPGAARKESAATTAPREALDLKSGQRVAGLKLVIAEGAASLSGRLALEPETPPPAYASMRVHLVPAAREQSDNPLRYYEATPAPDGTFIFRNLAPGRYLVLAREAEPDTPARARLRREAETANTPIELQPCGRVSDLALRFTPPAKE